MIRIYKYGLKKYVKELRKNMTPWERKLWFCFLKDYKVKWYNQRSFSGFIVDFFCRQAMLAVELDGSEHYTSQQMEYDKQRTYILNGLGIEVIRFSNLDVDKNFYGVCSKIDEVVKKYTTPQSAT